MALAETAGRQYIAAHDSKLAHRCEGPWPTTLVAATRLWASPPSRRDRPGAPARLVATVLATRDVLRQSPLPVGHPGP